MRKIAREAVIFCLLEAAIGSAYFLVQQYRSFRKEAASKAEQEAAFEQWEQAHLAPAPVPSPSAQNPTAASTPESKYVDLSHSVPISKAEADGNSKALILFQESLSGAIVGFSAGLAVWCAYRLVRFAILG
jgi:hypothetical protein